MTISIIIEIYTHCLDSVWMPVREYENGKITHPETLLVEVTAS